MWKMGRIVIRIPCLWVTSQGLGVLALLLECVENFVGVVMPLFDLAEKEKGQKKILEVETKDVRGLGNFAARL